MKRIVYLCAITIIFYMLLENNAYAMWYDYSGWSFPKEGPKEYSKQYSYSISLNDPYEWSPGGITLFSLNIHMGYDTGYRVFYNFDLAEGIDVGKDGYSNPQLITRLDLGFGASAWLEVDPPTVDIDFWCLDPTSIDLLALLGVNASVDLRLETPGVDCFLPFLKDGNRLIDISFEGAGIYKGDYSNTIYYNLAKYITKIPGLEANIGTALGIKGGVYFGLNSIGYYEGDQYIGEQDSAYTGADVSSWAGSEITVTKRNYNVTTRPYVTAGSALYLGFSIMGFTLDKYEWGWTLDLYVPPEGSSQPALFHKTMELPFDDTVPFEYSETYSVPSSQNVVRDPTYEYPGGGVDPDNPYPTDPPSLPENQGINVTSPSAGTRWQKGNSIYVSWDYPFSENRILTVELFKNGQYISGISSESGKTENTYWKIPDSIEAGNEYTIKVIEPGGLYGFSGSFSIVEESSSSGLLPISNFEEFKNIQENGDYYLTDDIDGDNEVFTPITNFKGTLDGRGHTIKDFNIEQSDFSHVGIFRYANENAVIMNLNIEDVRVEGERYIGLIAGEFEGYMENVHSKNCYIRQDEYADRSDIGGLVGLNYYGEIVLCSVTGSDIIDAYGDNVGGIAGESCPNSIIKYSWVSGKFIFSDSDSDYNVYGLGGIAGKNEGTIQECYTELTTIQSAENRVGGIAGENSGAIIDCFSLSGVDGDNDLGGIAGDSTGTITRSYATGPVDSGGGGIVGSGGTINDSLWDIQTTGMSSGGESCTLNNSFGKTTSEMKQMATYTALGWDFENIWQIDENLNYPRLRAAGPATDPPTEVEVLVLEDDPLAINISWSLVDEASFYRVYRAAGLDGTPQPISLWITGDSFKDVSTIPNTEYWYTVLSARTPEGLGASKASAPSVRGFRPKQAIIIVELSLQNLTGEDAQSIIDEASWYIDTEGPYKNLENRRVISPGNYTVSFSELNGYVSPDPILVDTEQNQTIKLYAVYDLPTGSLCINSLNSTILNNNGGRWRLAGGLWRNFGETVSDIIVGTYQIDFHDANGFITPENISIEIKPDTLTSQSIEYALSQDDLDSDGMPDGFEIVYFGDTSRDGTLDYDSDGLLDLAEYENGTDPTETDTDSDGMSDGFEITYFQNMDRDGTGDYDGDGLTDLEEHEIETVPTRVDTDYDGLSDYIEVGNTCTDPLDMDTDDDGIIDGDEDSNHNGLVDSGETNPCNADTDGDGIQDGTEKGIYFTHAIPHHEGETVIIYGTDADVFIPDADPSTTTDPLKADTDGDGISDGDEDTNHNGRVDPGESDPNPNDFPWELFYPAIAK